MLAGQCLTPVGVSFVLLVAIASSEFCPDLIKGASPDPSLKADEVGLQANSVREF